MSSLTILLAIGGVILLLIILVQFFRLRALRYKKQAESYGKIIDQQILAHKSRDRLQASLEELGDEQRQEQLNETNKMDQREHFANHWSAIGVRGESDISTGNDGAAPSSTSDSSDD